ncbi:protein rep [Rhizobium sp. WW_1]|uniref:protein rep n=1 Tax=Rhizobium sp. WW_1 TaxID=1907375 RepID=UPI000AC290E9|nr:protein rep [Rhizobium sp. WW_1]
MTPALGHIPADETPHSVTKKCQHISPSDCSKAKNKTSFKLLFADHPNAHSIDPYADGELAIRAAVSAGFKAGTARPKAAQKHAEGRALDNRGATFPGELATTVDEDNDQKKRKITGASRWRMKSKVVALLRPKNEKGPAVCGCGYAGERVKKETYVDEMGDARIRKTSTRMSEITLHRRETGAAVSGVFRCDSPWLCPTCAPARALRRKERVLAVINNTEAVGGHCAFVTLTVKHDLSMSLALVKKLLSEASRKARQGRKWQEIQAQGGLLGVVQGIEVLHNRRSGWHYHAHMIIPGMRSKEEIRKAARRLVARYIREVRKLGGVAKKIGQDVTMVWDEEKIAGYTGKGSACWEVAGGLKEARDADSRTPWDLVTLATAGDDHAKSLFTEYAAIMPGTRSCVVSPALAAKLCIVVDDDADQASEQQFEEGDDVVGKVEASVWAKILNRGVAWRVLNAVERQWEWSEIERLTCVLSQPSEEVAEKKKHAPTAFEIARHAQALVFRFKGRMDRAISHVLDSEEREAVAKGLDFKAPSIRRVMELVMADRPEPANDDLNAFLEMIEDMSATQIAA